VLPFKEVSEANFPIVSNFVQRRREVLREGIARRIIHSWVGNRLKEETSGSTTSEALPQAQFIYTEAADSGSVPYMDYTALTQVQAKLINANLGMGNQVNVMIGATDYQRAKANDSTITDRDFVSQGNRNDFMVRNIDGMTFYVVPDELLPVYSGGAGSWAPSAVGTAASDIAGFLWRLGYKKQNDRSK